VPVQLTALSAELWLGPATLWTAQITLPAPRGYGPSRLLVEEFETFATEMRRAQSKRRLGLRGYPEYLGVTGQWLDSRLAANSPLGPRLTSLDSAARPTLPVETRLIKRRLSNEREFVDLILDLAEKGQKRPELPADRGTPSSHRVSAVIPPTSIRGSRGSLIGLSRSRAACGAGLERIVKENPLLLLGESPR